MNILIALTMLLNPIPQAEIDFSILSNYGIDEDFGKAVAVVESGWKHNSRMARINNNLFGMIGKKFKSKNESIHYFGKLMNSKLYKNKSIEDIGKIYCPPTWQSWSSKVRTIMKKLKGGKY